MVIKMRENELAQKTGMKILFLLEKKHLNFNNLLKRFNKDIDKKKKNAYYINYNDYKNGIIKV